MSGIYEGPGGEQLHGDGTEVASPAAQSAAPMHCEVLRLQALIAELERERIEVAANNRKCYEAFERVFTAMMPLWKGASFEAIADACVAKWNAKLAECDAALFASRHNTDMYEQATARAEKLDREKEALAAALEKVLSEFHALNPEMYINVIPQAILANRDARIRAEGKAEGLKEAAELAKRTHQAICKAAAENEHKFGFYLWPEAATFVSDLSEKLDSMAERAKGGE